MKAIALAVLGLLALPAAAQTYKCVDPGGRVTYSNIACEKQGLANSGVVADRTSTIQAAPIRAPKPAAEKSLPAPETGARPAVETRTPQIVEPRIPRGATAEAQQAPRDEPIEIPPLPTVKPRVK
jgi:hypothetical protein